jgi:type VI secretion system protein ImpM
MRSTDLLVTSAPGWYGKLPVLGDFASRRLDQDFVDGWDSWLASGMLALRERGENTWLDGYLASPSWRFLLMPGVLDGAAGAQAWAGVLMPSVDRVGRYFPFTIAQPLGAGPASIQQMSSLWQWLGKLDDIAADAMHEDWSVHRLEDELARIGRMDHWEQAPEVIAMAKDATLIRTTLAPGLGPAEWVGMEAQALWRDQARGMAYWCACAEHMAPQLLRSYGLPDVASMHMLLDSTASFHAPLNAPLNQSCPP